MTANVYRVGSLDVAREGLPMGYRDDLASDVQRLLNELCIKLNKAQVEARLP
ncbi:hypothetical protein QEZ54_19765 [Catellatospora sp. KI3]|uniref:hypothetical protein n=1 Tax=Catellatospora sp. KI3 TaxID=3041620 RepID=UPI002482955F|nr:hypothetical protein [Catellatospora sp. KI3]MDI1463222.1 hypothetical protein [Catellatospora sp. KI3]